MKTKLADFRDVFQDDMFKFYYQSVTGASQPTMEGDMKVAEALAKSGMVNPMSPWTVKKHRMSIGFVQRRCPNRKRSTPVPDETPTDTMNFSKLADMLDEVSAKLRELEG